MFLLINCKEIFPKLIKSNYRKTNKMAKMFLTFNKQ